jgi:PAS domain S-box-containing protein
MQAIPPALRELWEQHSDGFSFLTPVLGEGGEVRDFRFAYVNPAAARLVGKSRESLIDRALLEEVSFTSDQKARAASVLTTGEPWTLDSLSFQQRRLRATLSRIGDSLALTLNDVTPVEELRSRVATLENQVENAKAEAEQAKALFETMFESSPIGYAVLDRSHRFVAANRSLLQVLTVTETRVEGRSIAQLWPDYGLIIEPVLDSVLKSGEPRLGNELQVKTHEGLKYLLFGTYPVKAGDQILGTGTFVLDMTDRKQVEEFQQQIMGIVGHDLRSPLQAVLVGAQGLLRQRQLGDEQRNALLRIQRCARRMTRLIDDLADFTRMRVGQPIAIHARATNIDEVCRQAISEMMTLYPDRIVKYHSDGLPDGHWDGTRLVQVVTNLLSNAIKYSPPESTIDVVWWREAAGEHQAPDLVLEVRNSGLPIDPKHLPHIFEPFRRGHVLDSLARTSLGLGLYIVKYLVEAHGGTVAVRSDSSGTAFTIRLPSARATAVHLRPTQSDSFRALVEKPQLPGTC